MGISDQFDQFKDKAKEQAEKAKAGMSGDKDTTSDTADRAREQRPEHGEKSKTQREQAAGKDRGKEKNRDKGGMTDRAQDAWDGACSWGVPVPVDSSAMSRTPSPGRAEHRGSSCAVRAGSLRGPPTEACGCTTPSAERH
jgi:hypothetical protein